MIEFVANGSRVQCRVNTGLPLDRASVWFTWDAGTDMCALLLARHLTDRMDQLVRRARQEEYRKGYRAGRGHHERLDRLDFFARRLE
jgi:hypothetical protein